MKGPRWDMKGCLLAAPTPLVTAAPALQLGALPSPTLPSDTLRPASSAWLPPTPICAAVGPRTGLLLPDAEVGTGGLGDGGGQGEAEHQAQSYAVTKHPKDNKEYTEIYLPYRCERKSAALLFSEYICLFI